MVRGAVSALRRPAPLSLPPPSLTDRLTHLLSPSPPPPSPEIAYDTSVPFQSILGFGGAFTDAAALNYAALSRAGKQSALDLLFGSAGLGYSLGRTSINSCDFSAASYSFDDEPGDYELAEFDSHASQDSLHRIPLLLAAASALRAGWGEELRLVASPWSPPAWMKADPKGGPGAAEDMLGSAPGCLLGGARSKEAAAWALYFSKWLAAYERGGVPVWAVTPQNEPEFAAPWEACSFTGEEEAAFVEGGLGPVLGRDFPNVKVLGFDHNKDHAPKWAEALLPSEHIGGIGYHWYAGGMDRLLDGAQGTPNLHRLAAAVKARGGGHVLQTEACHCPSTGYAGGSLPVNWKRAERYGHAVLADLAAGSEGWIEWNLILDKLGGPNHLGNVCDAPLLNLADRAGRPEGGPVGADSAASLPAFEPLKGTPNPEKTTAKGDEYR